MDFANTLRTLRQDRKLTQEALADQLGLSRSAITGYETRSRQPDFEKLDAIATFFDVSLDFLIRGEDYVFDNSSLETALNRTYTSTERVLTQKLTIECKMLTLESKKHLLAYIEILKKQDNEFSIFKSRKK